MLIRILWCSCVFVLLVGCGGGGGSGAGADATVSVPVTDTDSGALLSAQDQVPLYRLLERSVTNDTRYANKFTDVALDVEYISPSGRTILFPGFYDGDGAGGQDGNVWKIRFMPDEAGTWRYTYAWSDGTRGDSGTFTAVAAGSGRGVLKAYRANSRWFAYNGTQPVFLRSYHIGAAGFVGLPLGWAVANVYAKLIGRGYNHVMLKALPIGWTDEKPADAPGDHLARPLWRDTPRTQDLQVWKRFEDHMKWLNARDIGVHFFMGFDPKSAGGADASFALQRWTALGGDDQELYVRYVVARLAAFANVAGWNYTWETDGKTGERRLMELLARFDPWKHLATYHDEAPAANGYGDARYSFAGIENHGYFGNVRGAPALDSASHYLATIDAYRGKPVYMVEGNGLWRGCWAKDAAESSITRAAWAVTLAGGSFNWQDASGCFKGPIGDMFSWPAANPVANRLDVLYAALTRDVAFERMAPRNDLLSGCPSNFNRSGTVPVSPCYALAEPGAQYLVYKENGGSFGLNLAMGNYAATWIDTRSGARQPANGSGAQGAGAAVQFVTPDTATDWVLLLKSAS